MYNENGHLSSIKHILSPISGNICDVLQHVFSTHIKQNSESFLFLLQLGAIYHNKKRATPQSYIKTNDYLRIHTQPKRYKTSHLSWSKLVLFENDDYLIFNKPPGLPSHPTVDNQLENALSGLEKSRGTKLFITHRLDQETQGKILFAKTKKFQNTFNQLLKEKKVKKLYLAKIKAPLDPLLLHRPIIHYMQKSPHSPKKLSRFFSDEYPIYCEIEILSQKIDPNTDIAELTIELKTGRTHQIRAQLSDLGHPILGDSIYGENHAGSNLELYSHDIQFQ